MLRMLFWEWNPNEILGTNSINSNEEYSESLLATSGLNFLYILKRALMPAAAVVGTSSGHIAGPHCSKSTECISRPSELPIYPVECKACKSSVAERKPNDLEKAVGTVRRELWVLSDGVHGYKQQVVDFIDTGVAHSSCPGIRPECNFGRDHIAATLDWECNKPTSRPPKPEINYVNGFRCDRKYNC